MTHAQDRAAAAESRSVTAAAADADVDVVGLKTVLTEERESASLDRKEAIDLLLKEPTLFKLVEDFVAAAPTGTAFKVGSTGKLGNAAFRKQFMDELPQLIKFYKAFSRDE